MLFICCCFFVFFMFLCLETKDVWIQPLQHITQPFYRSSTYISLKRPALRVKSTLFCQAKLPKSAVSVYVILCNRKCIWCTYCLVVGGQIKHYEWGLFLFLYVFFPHGKYVCFYIYIYIYVFCLMLVLLIFLLLFWGHVTMSLQNT